MEIKFRKIGAIELKETDLMKISDNLQYLKDTCNVYVIKGGDKVLLIDFGSGEILNSILDLGKVEWILHTHCHRDQCQGDSKVCETLKIAVPFTERGIFENVEKFWGKRQIFHYYGGHLPDSFFPRESNKVSAELKEGDQFAWRNYTFNIKSTPGHTPGSITLIAEIDGRKVAFCGDLIWSAGKNLTIHNLQWRYGGFEGAFKILESISRLESEQLDLLLPSHGNPITEPHKALSLLRSRIDRLLVLSWEKGKKFPPPAIPEKKIVTILPRLFYNPNTNSHFYAIISKSGKALLLDYGCSGMSHIFADKFTEHSIEMLKKDFGLKSVEIVVPSHYHDDHISGILHLQKKYGTKIYAYEGFADILENPEGYNIPCLQPESVNVDKKLKDGESFFWEDYNFTAHHLPGHTGYAMGLSFMLEGKKVMMTGDNLNGPELVGNVICKNWLKKDNYIKCAKKLIEIKPDLVLTGHNGPQKVTVDKLNNLLNWAEKLEQLFENILPKPTNIGLDPNWVTLYPYYCKVKAGETHRFQVKIRNYYDHSLPISFQIKTPNNWTVKPKEDKGVLNPSELSTFKFSLQIPKTEKPGRKIICVDLSLPQGRLGEINEAIIDVKPTSN